MMMGRERVRREESAGSQNRNGGRKSGDGG